MRLLAIDTGSPTTHVALGEPTSLLTRTIELRRTSECLLPAIDALLAEHGWRLCELDGMLALAGPGSFTGLRIGLATIYGLHQASAVPATAIPTLDVLAAACPEPEAVAAVDSLRGEWLAAPYRERRGTTEPRLVTADVLIAGGVGPGPIIGCGVSALGGGDPGRLREPPPLAAVALDLAAAGELGPPGQWDALRLTRPLYARPAATTTPRAAKSVGG